MTGKGKTAVVYGGSSNEREVSLHSGEAVALALKSKGYDVALLDFADSDFISKITEFKPESAFLALHGAGGEDGIVQGILEYLHIPYIGSGIMSSALSMNKDASKRFYAEAGLSVPESALVTSADSADFENIFESFGGSVVVKAVDEGSARNVYICENKPDFLQAAGKLAEKNAPFLIEKFVPGREVTVGILDDGEKITALPIIEIIPKNKFYDYESKYDQGGAVHVCPAQLSDETARKCKDYAVAAHKALGCDGVSRSDFIIDSDGEPWILETNTLPGLTSTSLLPDAARAAGMSFADLCETILKTASLKSNL